MHYHYHSSNSIYDSVDYDLVKISLSDSQAETQEVTNHNSQPSECFRL